MFRRVMTPIVLQMSIPQLLAQERVLNALPSRLRWVCTTRRDAKVLAEFRFPAPASLELDAQSRESKADVSAYVRNRLEKDASLASVLSSLAAKEVKFSFNESKGLDVV